VSILSVSIGHVIGLSRQMLADLGVAALLHDVGKITVPGDVLRKPSKLEPDEWAVMRRHPIEGVKMMLKMPGLSALGVDAMRSCLEHHMNYDGSGYPKVSVPWNQGTLSRIVAMADCFDAMTAHRAYAQRPFTPFEALRYIATTNPTAFDPAVRWALVQTVGLYPPGTGDDHLVGTAVLSLTPNPDDLRRPICRVLVHPDGRVEPRGRRDVEPDAAERAGRARAAPRGSPDQHPGVSRGVVAMAPRSRAPCSGAKNTNGRHLPDAARRDSVSPLRSPGRSPSPAAPVGLTRPRTSTH
jgi:hypothetical protein